MRTGRPFNNQKISSSTATVSSLLLLGGLFMNKGISAIDLFCGAGGLSHGFVREGIRVNAGIDLDPACRFPFEYNNAGMFIQANVQDLDPDDIAKLFPRNHVRILAGCAPCQPFSTYKQRTGGNNDERWSLLNSFSSIVERVLPEIVTMENVPNLVKHEVFADFVKTLESNKYYVAYSVVACHEYGVPQTRKRLVLLASRLGSIQLLPGTSDPSKWLTVEDAIGNMPRLDAGQTDPKDRLHRAQNLSDVNKQRIQASVPGGTWRDWPENLRANCHQKASGKTYPSVYGRMEWNKPAPTMTTQCYNYGSGRFGHPEQDRAISLREAALLQSFPREYFFVSAKETINIKKLSILIGNAVPVELGSAIARTIREHVAA